MKKINLIKLLGFSLTVCGVGFAQDFSITDYSNGTITVEYPACFEGAYLFVEESTNLAEQAWEAVDYTQVEMASGDAAVDSWTGGIFWQSAQTNEAGYFRFSALSFIDSDGDGVDNLTEFARGTDPFTPDASSVSLPADDGDPRPVPGSVNSSPGDWNSAPLNIYRIVDSPYEEINKRILALDGTNGIFTAGTPLDTLGAWIEAQCGTWQATDPDDLYPTVSGGRFYRTPDGGFTWAGKEHVFALAFSAYDGSEAFVNHLVQTSPSDPAGLAELSDGSPVLVDAGNLWTAEKLKACLEQMKTIECRVQKLSGSTFDLTDTTAFAQAQMEKYSSSTGLDPLAPTDRLWQPNNVVRSNWEYDWNTSQWVFQTSSFAFTRNQYFDFLDGLQAYGFGPTTHRGYVGVMAEHDWQPDGSGYKRSSWQTVRPAGLLSDLMTEMFVCSDNESTWFMQGQTNYCDSDFRELGQPDMAGGQNYYLTHQTGFQTYEYAVLSTIDPIGSPKQTLVMDMDRDGTIDTNDWNRVDESHPYCFWVNCDADDRNGEKFYLPNDYSPLPADFYVKENKFSDVPGLLTDVTDTPGSITTLNDLEDFFPAMIQWPEGIDTNATVKLFANVKIGVVDANLNPEDVGKYLTDLTIANAMLTNSVQVIDPANSGTEITIPSTSLDKAMLIEVHEENANAMLFLTFDEGGGQVSVFTNHFSFTSVEKMFRYKNLRQGNRAAAADRLDEPENWPDELCNDANFFFVHGFNVSEPRSRASQANMFKRLYWSGSNARFCGVSWDGNPRGFYIPLEKTQTHYHNSVVNAFATAPALATFLNSQTTGGRKNILMAHSLGNCISSSAICDHGAQVDQYYLVDAAVAKEAYGDVTPNPDMIPDGSLIHNQNEGFLSEIGYSWHKYPFETYASEYYRLFRGSGDARTNLTWRHRFADIQTKTDAFNFYSSTEDVLRVDGGYTTLFSGPLDWDIWNAQERISLYAFQLQELFKGKSDILADAGGGSDPYTGWGFTTESDTHIVEMGIPWTDIGLDLWPRWPRFHHEQLETNAANTAVRAAFRETLKSDPLFRPNPSELFEGTGAGFASSTVGSCGYTFNYDLVDSTIDPIDLADVPVRDYLLAKAFPARTGALGSRAIDPQVSTEWQKATFDMSDSFMNDPAQWPHKEDGVPKWWHSDMRDLPYVHNYKFFDKLTGSERIQL